MVKIGLERDPLINGDSASKKDIKGCSEIFEIHNSKCNLSKSASSDKMPKTHIAEQ